MFEKKDAAKKTDIFCICYFSKNEAKPREKNRGHCLTQLNNQHEKLKAILAMFNFSQNSLTPFFHQTLQLEKAMKASSPATVREGSICSYPEGEMQKDPRQGWKLSLRSQSQTHLWKCQKQKNVKRTSKFRQVQVNLDQDSPIQTSCSVNKS